MGGTFRRPVTRRAFLARTAALAGAVWLQPFAAPALRRAAAAPAGRVVAAAGTTLERTIVTVGDGPYFRLAYGPGWPIVIREELAPARPGRDHRHRPLTAFLHVTDFQLVDAQSPARVEFFDRLADEPVPGLVAAAHRPQEALVCHVVEALVRQARAVTRGPVTGLPVGFTISTGDNLDNAQLNELRWFTTLLNGGELAANSGAGDRFEGVQSFDEPEYYDPHYWHPEPVGDPRGPDVYKASFGFPDYPGLLAAAIRPFVAAGLPHRWYSVYGNHDYLVQGNVQPNPLFDGIATGPVKVLQPPPGTSYGDLLRGLEAQDPTVAARFSVAPARPVTPDPERNLLSPAEYIRAHLEATGPHGPRGHGFTEDNLDPVHLYYVFEVASGIRGIVLDTCSPASSEGSVDETQLRWLEQRLIEAHHHHYDSAGNRVATGNDDQLVVIFSHHRPDSLQPIQGPTPAGTVERRYGRQEVVALLHRFPNVVLWVNGHSHENRVVAHPDPAGRSGGFWDVTTAAQIDPPQQARVIELVDNRDGTLSIFCTVVDHAAGPATAIGDYDVLGLAAIGRELAYNDPQADVVGAIGRPEDRNVELVVAAPFDLRAAHPVTTTDETTPAVVAGDALAAGNPLPATGGGVGAAALTAALAETLALRRRGDHASG